MSKDCILSQLEVGGKFYHVMELPADCRLNPPDADRPEMAVSRDVFDRLKLTEENANERIRFSGGGEKFWNLWSVERHKFEAVTAAA